MIESVCGDELKFHSGKGAFTEGDVCRAELFVRDRTSGLYRKNGDSEISPPEGVVAILRSHRIKDPLTRMLAWLHDLFEDQRAGSFEIFQRFGPEVANLIWYITRNVNEKYGWENIHYRNRIAGSPPQVKIVKSADILQLYPTLDVLSKPSIIKKLDDTPFYAHYVNEFVPSLSEALYSALKAYVVKHCNDLRINEKHQFRFRS